MRRKNWLAEFGIGVSALDEQHKALFHAVTDLEVSVRNKAPRIEVETALSELGKQAKAHFTAERRLMAAYDFPDREQHTNTAHARLFDEIASLDTEFHTGTRHVDAKVLSFLHNWLARHIEEDKSFGIFMNSADAIVNVVNQIILNAREAGASDIHVNASPGQLNARVRFRKDGALFDHMEIPADSLPAVLSRIKIMGQMDISERRKPQDGKIDFSQFSSEKIELRVATIPTANGLENIVMRLISTARLMPLGELGLGPEVLAGLKDIAAKPYGLFLVCGPTGAGKTTTLHSILADLNTPERKIWTAEDPIEIGQLGLCQVQVNPRIGWTFAAAMRSLLRADPDIIMVGEMRDAETTRIAIEASLTGHLVFSTLHTNSAPESIVRLLDLGMDRFSFADALLGVLAQRLAKRLCGACKVKYVASTDEIAALLDEYCLGTPLDSGLILQQWRAGHADRKGQFHLHRSAGCPQCRRTGYAGRIALHELLTASATIRRLIQTSATVDEIRGAGIAEGMRALKQSGISKVMQGETDIHQVRAVCG